MSVLQLVHCEKNTPLNKIIDDQVYLILRCSKPPRFLYNSLLGSTIITLPLW